MFKIQILAAMLVAALPLSEVMGGFMVKQYETTSAVTSLATADALIALGSPAAYGIYDFIDFDDNQQNWQFAGFNPFPNSDGTNPHSQRNNTFALHVTGFVQIDTAGTYDFRTYNDDGLRLRVGGTNVILDDATHAQQNRFGSRFLTVGFHAIDLVFFENAGGALLEFSAKRQQDNAYQLVGSPNGLRAHVSVPEPSSIAAFALIAVGGIVGRRRNRNAAR